MGVHLAAKVVNDTTSEKNTVTLSNDSGETLCPSFNLSATDLKGSRYFFTWVCYTEEAFCTKANRSSSSPLSIHSS